MDSMTAEVDLMTAEVDLMTAGVNLCTLVFVCKTTPPAPLLEKRRGVTMCDVLYKCYIVFAFINKEAIKV